LEKMVEEYRKVVPFVEIDTVMYPLIESSVNFVSSQRI